MKNLKLNLEKSQKWALKNKISKDNKDFESTIKDANNAFLDKYDDGSHQLTFKGSFIGLSFDILDSEIKELLNN